MTKSGVVVRIGGRCAGGDRTVQMVDPCFVVWLIPRDGRLQLCFPSSEGRVILFVSGVQGRHEEMQVREAREF